MNPTPEQIIRVIIRDEMIIPDGNIWVRDQNIDIPNTNDLFVVVGMIDEQVISNTSNVVPGTLADPTAPNMTELQEVRTRANIQIDILSRSVEAISRRWEILASLTSVTSVQLQEDNYFKIFGIPANFINTSDTEGGSKINKFSITVATHAWFRKEKVLESDADDFYETFETRVDDESTIATPEGLIEFTIEEPTP